MHSKKKARHYISDSEDEPSEDDEENPIRNKAEVAVNLLLIAGTLLQHAEVHKVIEDTSIEFGKMLLLKYFNESQCLMNFRFKQVHLRKVLTLLWSRLEPHLEGGRHRIVCQSGYTAHYKTTILIMLYRFSRPVRLRPEMEAFF